MGLVSHIDHKTYAKVLYDNRMDRRYLSKKGQLKILIENGLKLSPNTFDSHHEAIKAEIDKIHNLAHRQELKPAERDRMERLFPMLDYIAGLKRIWDGEPDTQGKYPQFRDKLQAGKQASEFFGWNAQPDQTVNINNNVQALIVSGKMILDSIQIPDQGKKMLPIE